QVPRTQTQRRGAVEEAPGPTTVDLRDEMHAWRDTKAPILGRLDVRSLRNDRRACTDRDRTQLDPCGERELGGGLEDRAGRNVDPLTGAVEAERLAYLSGGERRTVSQRPIVSVHEILRITVPRPAAGEIRSLWRAHGRWRSRTHTHRPRPIDGVDLRGSERPPVYLRLVDLSRPEGLTRRPLYRGVGAAS